MFTDSKKIEKLASAVRAFNILDAYLKAVGMTFAPDLQVVRSAAVYADTWLKTSSSSAALATIDANALSDCYKKLKETESSLNVQGDPPPAEGETEVKLEGDDADEDDAGGGQPQKSGKKKVPPQKSLKSLAPEFFSATPVHVCKLVSDTLKIMFYKLPTTVHRGSKLTEAKR